MKIAIIICILMSYLIDNLSSQEHRWIKVGSLHSWYRADGCEPEIGRTNNYSYQQDGLRWPAQYQYQDCQVAKGLWIGTTNYTDAPQYGGNTYPYKVVHCGPRVSNPDNEFMPIEFKLVGRFDHPLVSVDGMSASGLAFDDQLDEIDESLSCDRMIYNEVNTSIGITMIRSIMGWTHQDHDNYFIYQYTFSNTGNVDTNPEIEQFVTLQDVYFFFQYRYAPSREPFSRYSSSWVPYSCMWGNNTMLDARGEDPNSGDPFRALFAWHGKHSQWAGPGDNIGGPNYLGDGHLAAAQYLGTVVLHADKSANDKTNDPFQPQTTQYIHSDDAINGKNSQFDSLKMSQEYAAMIAGHPVIRHADAVGDDYVDLYGGAPGGFSHTQGFGPYTLAPGEEINIIIAEGVSGLSREKCYEIGDKWLNGSVPFTLPDGSTTSNRDQYKNAWVFTGKDSLFQTFENATLNYENGLSLSHPPPPPSLFNVISDMNKIILEWDEAAESDPTFTGYKIFRANGQYDAEYDEIFACGPGTDHPEIVNAYDDELVVRGFSYFYYIVSFSDGSTSQGEPLYSSLFWTRTTEPAYLRAESWIRADLYVSPDGDDSKSGLSELEPLRSLGTALKRILGTYKDPRTIHLAPGIYSPSTTGEPFPLDGRHNVTIVGESENETILSAEDSSGTFYIPVTENFNLKNLTIQGGLLDYSYQIFAYYSDMTLENVTIKNNQSRAIRAEDTKLSISDVTICDNKGTGIYYKANDPETYLYLKNVTLKNNGLGIYIDNGVNVEFDKDDRCNIYHNKTDLSISTGWQDVWPVDVYVDTFTVFHPSNYHTYPAAGFNMDILHAKEQQVASDLYVDPSGNDDNTGLSPGEPLKTIEKAIRTIISDSLNPRTIYLSPGIYGSSTTGESFPIRCQSYVSLHGENPLNTILDADKSRSTIMKFYRNKNIAINNLWFRNVYGSYTVDITASLNVSLNRVAITDNTRTGSNWGPALKIDASDNINLYNITVAGNSAFDWHGDPAITAAIRSSASNVAVINSIIWYNGPEPIQLHFISSYGGMGRNLSMVYSNLEFGDSCLAIPVMGDLFWLEGNLDTDPVFRDTLNGDYRLRTGSPCIDTGIQDTVIVYNDGLDTIYVPAMEYLGNAPDMGAFEFDITGISKSNTPSPLTFALHQNYPNPFNPLTNISFDLPKACNVKLEIYNSLGQKVQTLINADKTAGRHKIRFNASHLASGVYFYLIKAESFIQVRKMLLIK